MALNLPSEKLNFDHNKCQFGNFTNVPTTGCIKLKMKVTYVYLYEWMEGGMGGETHYTQFMYTMTIYTYYTYILL